MRPTLLVGALLASSPLLAQSEPPTRLEPLVVIATGSEQPLSTVLAPVIVIDRAAIERSQAVDLAELLRFHAGLEIGRNGGPGTTTSVFIRGGNSNHSLVLVDGVRINALPTGTAALQNLSPEMIERIEILKGPRATLYGSEALGGVINVVTRRARGATAHALVRGGSNDLREIQIGGGARDGGLDLHADLGHVETEGYIFRQDAEVPRGTRRTTANLRGGLDLGALRLDGGLWHTQGRAEYYGFAASGAPPPLENDFRNQTAHLGAQIDAGWGPIELGLSRMRDEMDQRQSTDYAHSQRDEISLRQTVALDSHALNLLLSHASETGDTLSFGTRSRERRDLSSVGLQGLFDFGALSAVAGVSHIDHDAFGEHTHGNLELGWRFASGPQLVAGIGSGFRAPTVVERFGFGGNPGLKAERAVNLEAGLRWPLGTTQQVELRAFRSRTRDLINFQCDASFNCQAVNIDRAENEGLDLRYQGQWNGLFLQLAGTLQDPRDVGSDSRLLRRARRSLTASVSQDLDRWQWGLDLLGSGDRKDFGGQHLPGYALLNLTAGWRLTPALQLQGRVENLLDTAYETARGFKPQDRSGSLSLRYQWQR